MPVVISSPVSGNSQHRSAPASPSILMSWLQKGRAHGDRKRALCVMVHGALGPSIHVAQQWRCASTEHAVFSMHFGA